MAPDPSSEPRKHRTNLIAWLVILVCLGGYLYVSGVFDADKPAEKRVAHVVVSPQMQMMMRMANGLAHPDLSAVAGSALLGTAPQIEEMTRDAGSGAQLAGAAILARSGHADAASRMLAKLEQSIASDDVDAGEKFKQLMADTRVALDLLPEPVAGSASPAPLSAEARARLAQELGEPGRTLGAMAAHDTQELLALSNEAYGPLVALCVAVCAGCLLAFMGLLALGTFLVLACLGKVRGPGPSAGVRAPLYAELFAAWMASYLLLARVPHLLWSAGAGEPKAPPPSPNMQLVMNLAAMTLSITFAILWIRWRGVTWKQVRQDVALTPARLSDLAWGFVTYSMGLTLLVGGVIIYRILEMIVKPAEGAGPTHPVLEWVQEGSGLTVALTLLLASVCAPLTEEFLFRGSMYRNLRDSFGRAGPVVAAVGAVGISSVIFAGIHPQGLIFIPVLSSLAVAFCIMREWRGSINPGMWAHAINNSVMITLLAMLAR